MRQAAAEWPEEVKGETLYEPKPGELEEGEVQRIYATHQARYVFYVFSHLLCKPSKRTDSSVPPFCYR
jgi:hypothetical protein